MYMVANAHLWSDEPPARAPFLNLPTAEALREAFAIGRQEAAWRIEPAHREVLAALLKSPKPADRETYELALDTLHDVLAAASDELAETLRNNIARMMVAVAHASGDGIFGTGDPISPAELECIDRIAGKLDLDRAEAAAWLIEQLHKTASVAS